MARMSPKKTDVQDEELRDLFETIDENNDGVLSKDEIKCALERLQFPSSDEHIAGIFRTANASGSSVITFQEFKVYVANQVDALRHTFDEIDKDHSGTLEPDEVQESIEEMYDIKLPIESVNVLMAQIGANPGHITFQEYREFLMMLPIHCHGDHEAMQHIFDYWKDVASVDFGEGAMNMMGGNKINFSETLAVLKQSYPSLAAGGVAGVVSRTCTAPLDRLKTIMQLQTETHAKFRSVASGLSSIWTDGGLRGFFQGNGLNCAKILPESATKFFVYENIKMMISQKTNKDLTVYQRFLAGAAAGAISQLLVYPVDCLKTRIAASPVPVSFGQLVSKTYHTGGPVAFYRGVTPSLLGMVPYAGIDLALYETLKKLYTDYHLKKSIGNLVGSDKSHRPAHPVVGTIIAPLVCGTMSSAVAQLVAYPLSLVRTRMQAQGSPTALGRDAVVYTGMWDVFVKTVKNEGIRGLYKGLGPNYLKVIPSVSISYLVYENTKAYFCKNVH